MDPPLPPPSAPPPFMAAAAINSITAADFSLAVAAATEATVVNNVAQAANATPAVTQPSASHPPYAEMIYAAIGALKERDGSSKRAIAKYIEKAYTGLPSTHSALLTYNLKRLKNNGLLVMVKKSYKLPRSNFKSSADGNINGHPQPPAAAGAQFQPQVAAGTAVPLAKRGRGRPPKAKPNGQAVPFSAQQQPSFLDPFPQPIVEVKSAAQQLFVPSTEAVTQPFPDTQLELQFQPQPAVGLPPAQANSSAQPVLVALGLADEQPQVAKRAPGRPKKLVAQGGGVVTEKGRGRPPKSGLAGPKKTSGRPRKPKSVLAANGVKRGPGRPPKVQPLSVAVHYATGGTVIGVPRPRGRPKKPVGPAAGGGAVLLPAKRSGRLLKYGGIKKPKKSTGRPVGRPKKNANASWEVIEVPQPQTQALTEANADLKRKLEFFQSRVGQTVGLLRPLLTSDAISAIAAVQELEGLAAMDINVPFRQEAQPLQIQS
uniref:Histone n=1 Tax=Rhizophora mucronata TaxID=61149 RepID=A0A2P2LX17_RHIMU